MSNRAYDVSGKNPTLTTSGDSSMIVLGADFRIRRLTPRECLRLQSVPENVIDKIMQIGISYSQLYKMAGNGWNCEVIKHIFSYLQWSK